MSVDKQAQEAFRNVQLDIRRFQREYPECTKREASLNYMRQLFKMNELREAAKADALQDEEALAERKAIQLESLGTDRAKVGK